MLVSRVLVTLCTSISLVEFAKFPQLKKMNDLRWQLLNLADEEDRRRRRRIEARRARLQAREFHLCDMTDTQFVKTYRLNKVAVRELVTLLTPVMPRQRRNDAMSVTTKVLIALSFYATGSYQTIVGQSAAHNMSQPSVSLALRQVTKALNTPHIFRSLVQFPLTRAGRDRVKQGFYRKYKIPGLVGAIDGTHVRIIRPSVQEDRYFNRKGYHSLNVMIVCDADLKILCVDPSPAGSTNDNIAWRTHPLHRYLNNKFETEQLSLLGDSGYALRKIMMTPPTNFLPGTPEAYFYDLHVTARNVVERCIGLLKARFRCLLSARMLHYDTVFAGQIVNACTALHNMALHAQIPVPQLPLQERRREAHNQVRRVAAEAELRLAQAPPNVARRVNIELIHGRAAQQALIQRLWDERNLF